MFSRQFTIRKQERQAQYDFLLYFIFYVISIVLIQSQRYIFFLKLSIFFNFFLQSERCKDIKRFIYLLFLYEIFVVLFFLYFCGMKRSVVIILILLISGFVVAQPPKPNHRSKNNAFVKNNEIKVNDGPIGTGSAFLLTLGTLTLALKLYKKQKH